MSKGKIKNKYFRIPNVIFSSQSSMIDWLILIYNYSPKFLWNVKSDDSKSDIFIELTYFDILIFGLGLKFLSKGSKRYKAFDFEKYIQSSNQIPLVIFPENTKTNRSGVLTIRSNLMDSLYNLINEHGKLLYRSEIIAKNYDYFSTHNTTEYHGLKNLFLICSQIYNSIEIVSQDLPNDNFDKTINSTYDRSKYRSIEEFIDFNLQRSLFEPNVKNVVSLNSIDHISFLQYFHETHKNSSYVKKEI